MKTPKRIPLLFGLAVVVTAFYPMAYAEPDSQEIVRRGAYLSRAGDCIACHTTQKGQPFAGGTLFSISVGKVYSTNITPDSVTGIGRYGINDFVKAMRKGIAKDGHHLFPAMPYPSYARITQEDLAALYVFFMQGVKPVHNLNRPAVVNWPLGIRSFMSVWNALYLKKGEYLAQPDKSVSWNRGAYLVQGLGHCGDCHTSRGIAGQVKANSEQNGGFFLAGAMIENWYAAPLTEDRETGLYAWSKNEIVEYLKTGRTARIAASGLMSGVTGKSTQYLNDPDLTAIAEYLKSLKASHNERPGNADSAAQTRVASAAASALRSGDTGMRGSRLYLDNCNACHGSDGTGTARTFPNLVNNEAVNAIEPISLIHILLTGSSMPSTQTAPSALAMPDFGWRLSDADAADVLNFVRGGWGNDATSVSRAEVRRVRKAVADKQFSKTHYLIKEEKL
jgi:alcohol dehydrogenase (quinone), cytochrome c subunit